MLAISRIHDTVEAQAKLVEGTLNDSETIEIIKTGNKFNRNRKSEVPKYKQHNKMTKVNNTCIYCGNTYSHKNKCQAEGVSCHTCGKLNHFSKTNHYGV